MLALDFKVEVEWNLLQTQRQRGVFTIRSWFVHRVSGCGVTYNSATPHLPICISPVFYWHVIDGVCVMTLRLSALPGAHSTPSPPPPPSPPSPADCCSAAGLPRLPRGLPPTAKLSS